MPLHRPSDFFVFSSFSALLQRIADCARYGYQQHIAGEVPLAKAEKLVEKFIKLYDVDFDSLRAYRARRQGKAVGRLFLWKKNEGILCWLLLLSSGTSSVANAETWKHQSKQKITIKVKDMRYELCQINKEQHRKSVWTWRINRDDYNAYLNAGLAVIQQRHSDLLQPMIRQLAADFLGFAGSRDQAKKAKDLLERAWKRSNGDTPPPHPFPEKFFYLRRVKDKGTTIRKLSAKTDINS